MTGFDINYKQALTFCPTGRGAFRFSPTAADSGRPTTTVIFRVIFEECRGASASRKIFARVVELSRTPAANLINVRSIEPGTYQWATRPYVDVNGDYKIHKHFALFANFRNILDASDNFEQAGPSTPALNRLFLRISYGSLWTIGLKGSF